MDKKTKQRVIEIIHEVKEEFWEEDFTYECEQFLEDIVRRINRE